MIMFSRKESSSPHTVDILRNEMVERVNKANFLDVKLLTSILTGKTHQKNILKKFQNLVT